jgi:hypothetical protein
VAPQLRHALAMRLLRATLAFILTVAGAHAAAAETLHPRIVNGNVTNAYPSVGALLRREPTGTLSMLCSGTLIGCNTVLTAAHCFCPPDPLTGHTPDCTDIAALTADFAGVFFQHAGLFAHASIVLHPDYEFGYRGDAAIIKLAQPVSGIAPSAFNATRLPPPNANGVIVGFGRSGGDRRVNTDYGIKRSAPISTALCPDPVAGTPHLCFSLAQPGDSGTCNGDSGGPLFMDFGGGPLVAGITSGGFAYGNCMAPAFNFNTNVFTLRTWIAAQLGSDPTTACGDLAEVGAVQTSVLGAAGWPDAETDEQHFRFDVPAGTQRARLALNGEDAGLNGDVPFTHGYRLYARQDAEPSLTDDPCGGALADPYKFCEIEQPAPGPLHVLLERVAGFGQYQLTLTLFAGPPITPHGSPTPTATARQTPTPRPTRPLGPCIGDCDHNGRIAINELVRGVGIALTGTSPASCARLDANGNGSVSINELVSAVGAALNGCIAQ